MKKMKNIKVIALDVDGTLTDGRVILDDNGVELKSFNVKDGLAISQAIRSGIDIVIITGRKSNIVDIRCEELGIKHVFQGVKNKKIVLSNFLESKGLTFDDICFVGDDINDLEVMSLSGYSACPLDAAKDVQKRSLFISDFSGGKGAVRQVIENIMMEKGLWNNIIYNYNGVNQ